MFGARFVVLLRQLNGLIAGSMAMPWPRFFVANALGGAAWAALWVLGPYYFADLFAWSGIGEAVSCEINRWHRRRISKSFGAAFAFGLPILALVVPLALRVRQRGDRRCRIGR